MPDIARKAHMAGMPQLKQALAEIVAVAEKYDVGLGVTLCNEDNARYLLRLPSWSIVRAAQDGEMPASVTLKEGERVLGAYHITPVEDTDASQARMRGTLYALSSTADNMRQYADTVDGILDGVVAVLKKQGISVEFTSDDDIEELAYTSVANKSGVLN